MAAPRSDVGDVGKHGIRHIIRAGKTQGVIRGLPLIQPYPADFHARFEGMPAVGPGQVIDHSVGCADFNVRRVVVESYEVTGAYRKRKGAGLRIVEWRAVDVNLGFIEDIGLERALQRQQVVRRVVDGLQLVRRKTAAIRSWYQADVALSTAVECGLIVEPIINSHEPCVFMDGGWGRGGDYVGVRVR